MYESIIFTSFSLSILSFISNIMILQILQEQTQTNQCSVNDTLTINDF
jgi:hypothetical protein